MVSVLNLAFMCLLMVAVMFATTTSETETKDMTEAPLEEKVQNDGLAKSEDDYSDVEELSTKSGFHKFLSNPLGIFRGNYGKKHDDEGYGNFFNPKPVTIIKTKTIEVTKRVTRHPVCMTVYGGPKPNCLKQSSDVIYYPKSIEETPENAEDESAQKEVFAIEPTATLKIPSDLSTANVDIVEEPAKRRSARYLTFGKSTPAVTDFKSTIEEGEIAGLVDDEEETADDSEGRILFGKPATKYVTKTIHVTKVQKVTNPKVTATLVVDNCVPVGTNIPICKHNQNKPRIAPTPKEEPTNSVVKAIEPEISETKQE